MDNFFLIKLPIFQPKYNRSKKYGSTNVNERKNLREVLEASSEGYCMYCYTRIRVDGKLYADLEHAIEAQNSKKLKECIPNIGLACATCNQSFKRVGERKRKLPKKDVEEFERNSKCSVKCRKQCTVSCKALKSLRDQYAVLPDAEIILQPMGMKGKDTREMLELQYDVLNMEFQPAENYHTYSEQEKKFIGTHIKRFKLNEPEYRTKQLFKFIRNIIDQNGAIPRYEYNNWIVEAFYRQIKDKPQEEVLKICESIFCIIFSKM